MEKVLKNGLQYIKEALQFEFMDDAEELYDAKNTYVYDNSSMSGAEICAAMRKITPDLPDNLIFFHDEIKKIAGNCVFVVSTDVVKAIRMANRSSLRMTYTNMINGCVVMVFQRPYEEATPIFKSISSCTSPDSDDYSSVGGMSVETVIPMRRDKSETAKDPAAV